VNATRQKKTTAKPVAKTAKPASKSAAKKPVKPAAKKAVKPAAKKPAKPLAKAVKPASKSAAKKPAKPVAKQAVKPAVKQAVKPAAKKAVKPVAKKPVKPAAKKAVKPTSKPVVKKAAKPAPKPVAKKVAHKARSSTPKKVTSTALAPAAKKSAPAPKAASAPKTVAAKPMVAAPIVPAVGTEATRKFTGRAAKAAAGVPPPPSAVPFSNPAKASFGPASEPRMPALVPVIPKKDAKLANNWKKKPVEQLSDAEVLAMPDGEYMNDTQMAFFRLKLQQLKRDILASAGETTEHLREDTVIVPDPADRATIEEEHALELRTRDRERKLLKKIEQSIQRIDLGDYGYCDETGEPIGVARLLARPTATLSLEAQQRRELKQKMFGD
jgi:DnaK suppressor protein